MNTLNFNVKVASWLLVVISKQNPHNSHSCFSELDKNGKVKRINLEVSMATNLTEQRGIGYLVVPFGANAGADQLSLLILLAWVLQFLIPGLCVWFAMCLSSNSNQLGPMETKHYQRLSRQHFPISISGKFVLSLVGQQIIWLSGRKVKK